MYVKNNDFYFSENDYLHFDKLKFTIFNCHNYKIVNRNRYNYVMNTIQLYANRDIYIDFYEAEMCDFNREIKLLITEDEYRNKMSLLYNLKGIISSICNALFLCKQYVNIFEYDNKLNIIIKSIREGYCKSVNLIELYEGYMSLNIDIGNPIKQDNTVAAIMYKDNNKPLNRIIIENNIIRMNQMIIVRPELYNIYYDKIITSSINFDYDNDYYIKKLYKNYYISYHTPLLLLIKFIDNIKLFDNIDEAYINSEYDMLKYI